MTRPDRGPSSTAVQAGDVHAPLLQAVCDGQAGRVARAAAEQAFARLYDATVERVYSVARRLTRDDHVAEEITEETYLQAWREAARYDASRGCVLAWLLVIARSRALDLLRRTQCSPVLYDSEAVEAGADAGAPDTLDLLAATDERCVVHAALERLPGPARQMVALAFLRGMTHSEIAEATQQPLGTVKTVIRRALAQMKTFVEQTAPQLALQFARGAAVSYASEVQDEAA
jgi:RNA polymerase sigma-70 factor (ECF subfamily)